MAANRAGELQSLLQKLEISENVITAITTENAANVT